MSKTVDMIRITGDKVLVPVATGAAGAVVGNQLPQNQRSSKKARAKIKDTVTKNLVPIIKSADPYFNQEAASKAAALVMKMDETEARVFTAMVVGDILEDTISKNRRTLQRHLDAVVSKRIDRIKKAMLTSTVSKGADQSALAYAQTLAKFEEVTKAGPRNPYTDYGYQFQESNFRRDPGTGRFQTKVKPILAQPLDDRVATSMGIPTNTRTGKNKLEDHEKARYQAEYLQLAQFLGAVNQSVPDAGFANVMMHIRDKNTGQTYTKPQQGTRPDTNAWNPKSEELIGVEALPSSLTVGGAAFSLANSLGASGHGGEQLAYTANQFEGGMSDFSRDWIKSGDSRNSNDRLYNRVAAGSKFLGQVAPYGSQLQVAAKFGEFVGSHGAEAEQVIGPVSRRAAYRYRGTEKTPDPELVAGYESAVRSENRPSTDISEEDRRAIRTARTRAVNNELKRKAAEFNQGKKIDQQRDYRSFSLTPTERVAVLNAASAKVMEARGIGRTGTNGNPQTWQTGRQKIVEHLREKMPSKGLYGLHLDAGNTPPSEGVLIDSKGQIVTQAIGYGDDHYLPFNLRNLSKLKGGEYIRTRSVGGPTSEDIYTGLVSGAKRIQVESRSGSFTVEFADDFVGSRRYNDKARRMVGRYQQLLDSVQSETVERKDVSPQIRRAITRQVNDEFSHWPVRDRNKYVQERINEFKENPEMSEKEEQAFELEARLQTAGMPDKEAEIVRSKMWNSWQNEKEYRFKLNGIGYEAALSALEEQFPYYIKVTSNPTQERERVETEKDKGYVEPGRNRPTRARAGWHGTETNTGDKFTASQANYQRGKYGVDRPARAAEPTPTAAATPQNGGAAAAAPAKATPVTEPQAAQRFSEVAARTYAQIQERATSGFDAATLTTYPFLKPENRDTFPEMVKDPQVAAGFERFMRDQGKKLLDSNLIEGSTLDEFNRAAGHINRMPWSPERGLIVTDKPFIFDGPEYGENADPAVVERAASALAKRIKPVSNTKSLDEMTTPELQEEVRQLAKVHSGLQATKDETDLAAKDTLLQRRGIDTKAAGMVDLLRGTSSVEEHIKATQQMLALNLNRTPQTQTTVVRTTAPALTTGDKVGEDNANDLRNRARTFRQGALALEALGNAAVAEQFHTEADLLEQSAERGVTDDEYRVAMDATEQMALQARDAIRRRFGSSS